MNKVPTKVKKDVCEGVGADVSKRRDLAGALTSTPTLIGAETADESGVLVLGPDESPERLLEQISVGYAIKRRRQKSLKPANPRSTGCMPDIEDKTTCLSSVG